MHYPKFSCGVSCPFGCFQVVANGFHQVRDITHEEDLSVLSKHVSSFVLDGALSVERDESLVCWRFVAGGQHDLQEHIT